MHRLERENAQLLIVDVQEKLCAAMPDHALARMVNRTQSLLEGARALGLPVHLTEQYRKGLGPTVPALMQGLAGVQPVEKLEFSACVPAVRAALGARKQVLLAGMEAHICVFQTARDLAELGFVPVVCADAVLSRDPIDLEIGLRLCREAGALVTSVEAALFDLLGRAGTPAFKAISTAVK